MSENLEKAKKDLNEFLDKHPELTGYQKEIEESLDGIDNPGERLMILISKMIYNNKRLLEILNNIKE